MIFKDVEEIDLWCQEASLCTLDEVLIYESRLQPSWLISSRGSFYWEPKIVRVRPSFLWSSNACSTDIALRFFHSGQHICRLIGSTQILFSIFGVIEFNSFLWPFFNSCVCWTRGFLPRVKAPHPKVSTVSVTICKCSIISLPLDHSNNLFIMFE